MICSARLASCSATNSRQLLAAGHVENPVGANAASQNHQRFGTRRDFTDERRTCADFVSAHDLQRAFGILLRNKFAATARRWACRESGWRQCGFSEPPAVRNAP